MKGYRWTFYTSQVSLANKVSPVKALMGICAPPRAETGAAFSALTEVSFDPFMGAKNMAARMPANIWRNDTGSDPRNEKSSQSQTDLAGVVVDDEALVPAVEVFVRVDLDAELLQHRLVGPLAHRVHGGAHVIQDAHDARRILPSHRLKSASFYLHFD